jgi:tetratricopeptide (TPR) repeat protein
VEDAYERAVESYNTAKELNPLNPGIDLALSRTALNNNKLVEARAFANQALELKPNFIDALLTLSQIARLQNNNQEAITFAGQALALDPTNQDLINYVSSLRSGDNPIPPPVTPTEIDQPIAE